MALMKRTVSGNKKRKNLYPKKKRVVLYCTTLFMHE